VCVRVCIPVLYRIMLAFRGASGRSPWSAGRKTVTTAVGGKVRCRQDDYMIGKAIPHVFTS
jgi:hypothetical protein